MLEMRNRARPQLDQVCLLHGVRMVEKSNRQVAELDLHVMEIVVWLALVSKLGMTRKENGYSILHIRLRRVNTSRGASILELAQGGGSPSNHHSITINSPLFGLQHTSDIRVELGIKEGAREHTLLDNSTKS